MKYSSGPQVPTMPKDGPNSVEVRSRAGDARQFSPSAARNCGPIREVLTRVLPKKGIALEIGSGTGEHVICFAKALPGLVWLPSDPELGLARQHQGVECHRRARQCACAGRHRRARRGVGRGGRRTI